VRERSASGRLPASAPKRSQQREPADEPAAF
jgi:hypothetical protein